MFLTGNISASSANSICGVPQGSILGPLLLLIYSVPIGHINHKYTVHLRRYTDDTQLYVPNQLVTIAAQRYYGCPIIPFSLELTLFGLLTQVHSQNSDFVLLSQLFFWEALTQTQRSIPLSFLSMTRLSVEGAQQELDITWLQEAEWKRERRWHFCSWTIVGSISRFHLGQKQPRICEEMNRSQTVHRASKIHSKSVF